MEYMRNAQCGCRGNGGSFRMNPGCGGADQAGRIPEPCRMPAGNGGCGCDRRDSGRNRTMDTGCRNEGRTGNGPEMGPLGMTYVPWQKWSDCELFELELGLAHGTIFRNLVFPFLFEGPGCRQRGGCR